MFITYLLLHQMFPYHFNQRTCRLPFPPLSPIFSLPAQLLTPINPLHSPKPLLALIENRIDALEEGVAQNIKRHVPPGLDAAVAHAVAGVGEPVHKQSHPSQRVLPFFRCLSGPPKD